MFKAYCVYHINSGIKDSFELRVNYISASHCYVGIPRNEFRKTKASFWFISILLVYKFLGNSLKNLLYYDIFEFQLDKYI